MNALTANGGSDGMAMLTVRNLPDDVHRALRVRAAQHGQSTEAEVRAILALGRELGLSNEDVDALRASRNTRPAEPLGFE